MEASHWIAEVVSGGRPSFLADAWSFGCLLHFLLTARPPIVGDDEESIKQRVVQFNVEARGWNSHALH